VVAVAEFAIDVALVAGFFTRLVAPGSLTLLFTCVMSGTASTCAFYAPFAIVATALPPWLTRPVRPARYPRSGLFPRQPGSRRAPAPAPP
jgi:uncharacterized membrane protein YphA (DoxX/SURF4 family)